MMNIHIMQTELPTVIQSPIALLTHKESKLIWIHQETQLAQEVVETVTLLMVTALEAVLQLLLLIMDMPATTGEA